MSWDSFATWVQSIPLPLQWALAVIGTLLLQALPAPWLAGRLGLLEPRTREVPPPAAAGREAA